MYNRFEKNNEMTIQLTKGDSLSLITSPRTNENEYAILFDKDYVMFTVKSIHNERRYIQKLLSKDDYDDRGGLIVKLLPGDTKDMSPTKYRYGFSYMPQEGAECHTYETGIFELLPSVNTADTLIELIKPDEDETPSNGESGSGESTGENIGG